MYGSFGRRCSPVRRSVLSAVRRWHEREYQCPGLRTHLAIWHLASLMVRIAAQETVGQMNEQPEIRPSPTDSFFQSIAAFESVLVPSLSYLAFQRGGTWHLFRGRINYNFAGYELEPLEVRTANVLAGTKIIDGGAAEAREIVERLQAGSLVVGDETLRFEPQFGGGYGSVHIPLLPEGAEKQFRMGLLQIRGSDQQGFQGHAPFDWELRAAAMPFDGIGELLSALNIAQLPEQASLFEALVPQVAAIDTASSVDGTKARLGISLAPRLEHSKASLGYRIISGAMLPAEASPVPTWNGHPKLGARLRGPNWRSRLRRSSRPSPAMMGWPTSTGGFRTLKTVRTHDERCLQRAIRIWQH